MTDQPPVWTILCTTSRRPAHWLPRAIRNWQAGDYPHRTLLIVDGFAEAGADDHVRARLPKDDPRIRYTWSSASTLGQKYNDGIACAPADAWIAFASDDDWSHPNRISATVGSMQARGVDIGGSISMLAWRERTAETWLYHHPYALEPLPPEDGDPLDMQRVQQTDGYLVGATIVIARKHWERCPFPRIPRGSDSVWIRKLLMQGEEDGSEIVTRAAYGENYARVTTTRGGSELAFVQINEPRMYVAMVHATNTGNELDRLAGDCITWSRVDYDLARVMGADAEAYGIAKRAA